MLAWYLVPADFGLVAIATTLATILGAVTEFSLSEALINHPKPAEPHFSAAWTMGVARGVLLGGLFAASAYPIAAVYEDPRLVNIVLALSLGIVISGFGNPRRVMLQRDLIFWQEFLLSVCQKLVSFLVTLAVAVAYQSYWALIFGILAYQLTSVIVSYMVLPFRPRITFQHLHELFSFSIWLTLGRAVNILNWRFEYLLIGKMLGAAPLGSYTVGSTLSSLPTRETTAPLMQTIYPAFASVRGDPARLKGAYQRAQALLTAVAVPAGIGVAVVADPLVRLVLGERWVGVIFIVQALASVFALQTLGSLVQPLGMALGKTQLLFFRDSQMLIVRLPIIIAGLLLGGLPGAVYGRVFAGLFGTVVNMFLVKRLIGLPVAEQLAANRRALTSVLLMAGGLWLTQRHLGAADDKQLLAIHLAVLVGVGALIYILSSILLWMAMGRPPGPETEVGRAIGKLWSTAWGALVHKPARALGSREGR
jgi:O-antigen/teichoic acid export membrane protein